MSTQLLDRTGYIAAIYKLLTNSYLTFDLRVDLLLQNFPRIRTPVIRMLTSYYEADEVLLPCYEPDDLYRTTDKLRQAERTAEQIMDAAFDCPTFQRLDIPYESRLQEKGEMLLQEHAFMGWKMPSMEEPNGGVSAEELERLFDEVAHSKGIDLERSVGTCRYRTLNLVCRSRPSERYW